jgi:hypothetical protein
LPNFGSEKFEKRAKWRIMHQVREKNNEYFQKINRMMKNRTIFMEKSCK